MRTRIIAALCVLLAGSAIVDAQRRTVTRVDPSVQQLRFEPYRPKTGNGSTRVVGTVVDIRQVPVKKARLQLRNLTNGAIVEQMESDDQGEYAFDIDDSGTYVVEMVMVDGYVVGLSNAGALSRFETLNTVIQLPGRWDSKTASVIVPASATNYIGVSAQTTMTSQTLSLAVNSNIAPADPGEPVSP